MGTAAKGGHRYFPKRKGICGICGKAGRNKTTCKTSVPEALVDDGLGYLLRRRDEGDMLIEASEAREGESADGDGEIDEGESQYW